jgi:small GTP-binding protein
MRNDSKLDDYDYLFKIILLGDTHVGKTSIVSQFVNKDYNKYEEPTIGVDFKVNCKTIHDKKVKLYLWDTAGQEKFHSIIQSYYKNVGGGVVVYDVTNTQSYNNVIRWIKEIRKYNIYENNIEIPILIFGNKSDLILNRKITTEMGQSLADKYNVIFYEGNVKNNKNIDLIFEKLGEKMFSTFIFPNIKCYGIQEKKQLVKPIVAFSIDNTSNTTNLTNKKFKIYNPYGKEENEGNKKGIDCNSCSIL